MYRRVSATLLALWRPGHERRNAGEGGACALWGCAQLVGACGEFILMPKRRVGTVEQKTARSFDKPLGQITFGALPARGEEPRPRKPAQNLAKKLSNPIVQVGEVGRTPSWRGRPKR